MRVRPAVSKSAWVCLGIVLVALIACDISIRAEGMVHDRQGNPLDAVTVRLESEGRGPHNAVTGKDGSFGLGIVGADPGQTKLVFQKEGYKTLEIPLGAAHANKINVTLEREVR